MKEQKIQPLPCPKCHQLNVFLDIRNIPEWETVFKGEHLYYGFHRDFSIKCGSCGWTPLNYGYKPWYADEQKAIEWWNNEVRKLPLY